MIPKISQRCSSCGASVREPNALFCPECGKPLSIEAKDSQNAEAGQVAVSAPAVEPESTPPDNRPGPTEVVPDTHAISEAKLADSTKADVTGGTHTARRGDKTRERLHRASGVARGVTRGVMKEPVKQVEKIRHVSSIVIEEASYDPSLRFVLVALGLFGVFVVLLVLSKVMG